MTMPTPVRVLLVEDNPDDADLIALQLARGGLSADWRRVDTAADMEAALAAESWDVVLSDYTLPGFGAVAALALARAADPDLPFVVVSGTIGEEQAVAAMRAGAGDYLLKGNLARLVPAIEREMQQAASRRNRRRAERAAAHLAALVASSEDAIISKDLRGVVTSWNPAAERLYGWSAGEAVGRHISFLVPEDRAEELAATMARLHRGDRVEPFETVRLHRDGTRIDVALTVSPVLDSRGRTVGASKIARDLRRMKRAEARATAILEGMSEAFVVLDEEWRVAYVNAAFERIVGTRREDVRGRNHWELYPATVGTDLEAEYRRVAMYGGTAELEFRYAPWDRWFAVKVRPGDGAGICIQFREVTEARRAQDAVRVSEERYRTLVAATAAIVWDSPASGEFDTPQPGWTAFTGQTVEQHRGWGWLDAVHPDDRAASAQAWREAVAARATYHVEHRLRRWDGEYRHMSVRAVPIVDAGGAIREWVGVHTDITHRREAEERLRRSEQRLRAAMEGSLDAVFFLSSMRDSKGRIEDFVFESVNANGERLVSRSRAELVGRRLSEVLPANGDGGFLDRYARVVETQVPLEEQFPLQLESRPRRWLHHQVIALGDGVAVTTRDVTTSVEAEQAVRLRDRALRAVAGGVVITDHTQPDGQLTYVSPGFERLTGHAAEDVIGANPRMLQGPGTDRAAVEALRTAVREGRECAVELLNYRKDGTPFWNAISIAPVRDDAGRVTHFVGVQQDATARRRAEEESARLAAIVAGSTDAIMSEDLAGLVTSWNPAAERLYGWTAEEALGRPIGFLVPADRVEETAAIMARLAQGERVEPFETVRLHRDGSRIAVALTLSPILDVNGRTVGYSKIIRDIRERLQAEEKLRASESRLRAVITNMTEGVILADGGGRLIEWNQAALRLHGYTDASEVLRPLDWFSGTFEFSTSAGRTLPLDEWPIARVLRGETLVAVELRVTRKDTGKETVISYGGTPVRDEDGRVVLAALTLHDMTEYRRVEAERDRLLGRMRVQIERMPLGYVLLDEQEKVAGWNPAAERIFGYFRDEVIGMGPPFEKIVPPEVWPALGSVRARAQAGDMAAHSVNRNVTKNGHVITCEWINTPLQDGMGRPDGVMCLVQDVTERQSLEQQLRHSQKMEAVGQLAGGVAHDFNNLLTVINGCSALLLPRFETDDPDRALVQEIQQAGERSAALTRQLLVFSRKQVSAPRLLDLNTVVADAERMLRRIIGEDIRLETALRPLSGSVKADPGQLEQVLVNLCVNARDAMTTGGRLTIETADANLDEEYARLHPGVVAGPHLLLAVSDTGSGMPEDVRTRIFDPFFTTKEVGHGTGLGLAVVHGIVKQAAGHVAVYSEVGLGTTFKIYLPTVREAPSSPGTSGAEAAPAGMETVLLVEDEGGVRSLARRILTRYGYTILDAPDGDAALVLARQPGLAIDLLLTDVVMPGLGGRLLAERVLALHPRAKVLYMSGYADDAIVRHGVLEQEVHFIQKPFAPAALARKVREVLDSPSPRGERE